MLGMVTKGFVGGGGVEVMHVPFEVLAFNKAVLDTFTANATIIDFTVRGSIDQPVVIPVPPFELSVKVLLDDLSSAASSKVLSSSAVIDKPSTKESIDDPIVISHWWCED